MDYSIIDPATLTDSVHANTISGVFDTIQFRNTQTADLTSPKELLNNVRIGDLSKLQPPLAERVAAVNYAADSITSVINSSVLNMYSIKNYTSYNNNNDASFFTDDVGAIARNLNALTNIQLDMLVNVQSANGVYDSKYLENIFSTKLNTTDLAAPYTPYYFKNYAEVYNKFTPKYKIFYIVKFELNAEYAIPHEIPTTFEFLIHKFNRPDIEIEGDDVNFYNHHVFVPKRTTYSPITFDIHDDMQNCTMGFIVAYMRRISPIFSAAASNGKYFEHGGLDYFTNNSSYALHTTADNIQIINNICIYHVYDRSRSMDTYTLFNPQITTIKLGDMDANATDLSSVSVTVNYSGLNIELNQPPEFPQPALDVPELPNGTWNALPETGAKWDSKYMTLNYK
jgi:hypothetical protein